MAMLRPSGRRCGRFEVFGVFRRVPSASAVFRRPSVAFPLLRYFFRSPSPSDHRFRVMMTRASGFFSDDLIGRLRDTSHELPQE